jgi:two-component system, NarL family, response regulator LiaR
VDLSRSDAVARRLGGIDELTPREMDVLRLLAQGLPNRKIGERLSINERTVKYHMASILAKLEAANRTEAIMRAIERGLITV